MKITKLLSLGIMTTAILALSACGSGKSADSGTNSKTSSFKVVNVRAAGSTNVYRTKGVVPAASKEAGVKIKWDTITSQDWGDKKGVLLAGGDLPDAFFGNNTLTDSDIANNESSLIPLEKYINKKTMPNLYKVMQQDPKMKAIATNADGHIYSLPSRMTGRTDVGNVLYINKKWLDKLGLKMPTTYKEFTEDMVKMANGDPNGNGKKDEVGLDGFTNICMIPWGVPISSNSSDPWMNYNNGKLSFTPTTDVYKKAINAMHDLYSQGGMDREFFTQDFSRLSSKIGNQKAYAAGVVTYTPQALGETTDEYVLVPALKGVDGKKHSLRDTDPYSRNQFEVTTACKNPKKLLSWIDKFYEPDNSIQVYYGAFGKNVKKNSNGTYTILKDPSGKYTQGDFAMQNAIRDYGPQYGSEKLASKINFIKDEGDGYRQTVGKEMDKYVFDQYPQLSFTTAEQKEISGIQADIDNYVNNKYAEWVTKGGVDSGWSAYLKQLNAMGLKRYMQIQNKALVRYNKTLKSSEN